MAKAILVIGVSVLGLACAFKSGAPSTDEVCQTMVPDHGSSIQPLNTFPYKVDVAPTTIKPGQKVTVTITGSDQHPIKGFLVEGRVGQTPIGRFEEGPEVQAIDCLEGVKNAVTHTNGVKKKTEVKLVWTAPKDLQENVKFRVTVVKKADVYWVGYETNNVSVTKS